jgi:hypothetical protein
VAREVALIRLGHAAKHRCVIFRRYVRIRQRVGDDCVVGPPSDGDTGKATGDTRHFRNCSIERGPARASDRAQGAVDVELDDRKLWTVRNRCRGGG